MPRPDNGAVDRAAIGGSVMSSGTFMPRMRSDTRAMRTLCPLAYRRVDGAIADVWNVHAEAGGGGAYVSADPRLVIFLDDAPTPIRLLTPSDGAHHHGVRAFFIPAHVPLSSQMTEGAVMSHLDIHLYAPSLARRLQSVSGDLIGKARMVQDSQTLLTLGRLAAQEVVEPRRAPLLLDSLINATLAEIFTTATAPVPPSRGLSQHQLHRIDRHLRDNIARQVGIAEMAEVLKLSTGWFAHAFKISRGVSPGRWQAELRLKIAGQMIRDEHASLAEIAHATGFADQAHLSRRFSAHHGTSPSRWRAQCLQQSGSTDSSYIQDTHN